MSDFEHQPYQKTFFEIELSPTLEKCLGHARKKGPARGGWLAMCYILHRFSDQYYDSSKWSWDAKNHRDMGMCWENDEVKKAHEFMNDIAGEIFKSAHPVPVMEPCSMCD